MKNKQKIRCILMIVFDILLLMGWAGLLTRSLLHISGGAEAGAAVRWFEAILYFALCCAWCYRIYKDIKAIRQNGQ